MAQEVGDAVLRFLGDSTQLDTKFDEVGPNAEKAFAPAAEAVEEAGQRMQGSMREARGEVRLLGEEFGIRLPRHVSNFVAELPGVGEAMSAAFSATAVLFIAQALVEATEKLSNFVSATFIYTQAMKDAEIAVAAHNKTMLGLNQLVTTSKEKVEALNGVTHSYTDTIEKQTAALLAQSNAEFESTKASASKVGWYEKLLGLVGGFGALEKKTYEDERQAIIAQAAANRDADQAKIKADADAAKRAVKAAEDHKAYLEQIVKEAEADTARTELFHKNEEAMNEADNARTALAKVNEAERVAAIQKENEADTARTTLLHQQKEADNEAENARHQMYLDHIQLEAEAENARAKMVADEKKELDNLKRQTEITFQAFQQAWRRAASATQQTSTLGKEAFNSLTASTQSAFQSIVLGQGNVAQALEKATASVLAQLAAQAAVKSLFYTAEGVASLWSNPAAANGYFIAAGEMAAVAAVAGVAGHELAGAAGGSGGQGNNTQSHNSQGNTSQSNRSGGNLSGVQHFATGGLISAPTLAIMGEDNKKEAVLPLEDPSAMKQIREGIGGGTTNHFHIKGMVSSDHLVKIVGQINKMVNKGQVNLTASNSLRLTKRSA